MDGDEEMQFVKAGKVPPGFKGDTPPPTAAPMSREKQIADMHLVPSSVIFGAAAISLGVTGMMLFIAGEQVKTPPTPAKSEKS